MHEHHQVKELVRQVFKKAKAVKAGGVNKVWVVLGEQTGYKEDSVRHYFESFTQGSIAEGAKLIFIKSKPKLFCDNCQSEFELKKGAIHCPSCKALGHVTRPGNEFYVDSIGIRPKKLSK